jgi:uncharacterized protein (DUF305 family)
VSRSSRTSTAAALAAIAAAGVAAVLVAVLASGGAPASPTAPPVATIGTGLTEADTAFVRAMAAQHEQTAAIVRLAGDRITDGELATLVAAIDATQDHELATLHDWLAAAAGGTPNPGAVAPSAGHSHPAPIASPDPRDIAALEAARGRAFDTTLANLLIARQQTAGELARAELGRDGDPAVRALARRIADSRAAQVGQLLRMVARLRPAG